MLHLARLPRAVARTMEKQVSDSDPVTAAIRWRALVLPVFVLLCWLLAIRHLSSEWTLNEQYHYGWTVPFLTLYLVRLRFENIPAAAPSRWTGMIAACLLLAAALEALLLPLREANADWRILGWLLTGLAVLAAMLALAQAGGASWVIHFALPLLFFFTAVPWPRPIEIDVMQWLMRHNAQLAAEILRWLGVPADVRGNLIQLSTGTIGIDEACSGIRSLQGSLMATLFVGEIFELKRWRRLLLLVAGLGWALVTNSLRTVVLALLNERSGTEALNRWHDPAGYWTLAACAAGVTATGWLLRRGPREARPPSSAAMPAMASSDWRDRLSAIFPAASLGLAVVLAGWGATEWWFRVKEASVTRVSTWSFRQPGEASHFASVEQSPHVRGELRYDFYSGGRWQDAAGRLWVAHYFRWDPGRNAVRTVIVHDPRVCIGAAGKEFVQTIPSVNLDAQGLVLSFDGYWFRDPGGDVYVFNCVAEDVRRGADPEREVGEVTLRSRLEAVRSGKRNLGQRRLEVAVWGAHDAAVARQAFVELLQRQIEVREISVGTRGS